MIIETLSGYVEKTCTLEDVRAAVTPPPTSSWVPIPHIVCLEGIQKALKLEDLEVESCELALTPGRNKIPDERFFALLNLSGSIYADYRAVCAIINTHDKYMSFRFAVGHSVFICTNLALSAEIVITRRHTANVMAALPGLMWQGIQRIPELLQKQNMQIEMYRSCKMEVDAFDHYAMTLMRADVLPVSKLEKLWNIFMESGPNRTMWQAFNACTNVLKDYNDPFRHNERTQKLHIISDDFI